MGPFTEYDLYERYTNGYLFELANSAHSKSVLVEGAQEDLDIYLDNMVQDAKDAGREEAWNDEDDENKREIDRLESKIEELQEKLEEGFETNVAPFIANLSYFLGEILDTSGVDTDDVEAWAFQDGHNEVIRLIMLKLEELAAEAKGK